MQGSFVVSSHTHGYMAFIKTYTRYNVMYAGEFDTVQQQSLVVRGSWYTEAGQSDGGPFTMTFEQPLSIVDTQPTPAAVVAAVVVADGSAASQPQAAPLPAAGGESTTVPAIQQVSHPTQSSDYQHLSESRSSVSSVSVSDVELVQSQWRGGDVK